jgi:putative addiction module killer protein
MTDIRMTQVFREWLHDLRDGQARVRIQARIRRIADGNPGQHRNLKGGVSEMKIDYGPGSRVYFTRRGNALVILLCGGDKSTQSQDIAAAERLAEESE